MAHDINIEMHRCHFCDRPAALVWDADLLSCRHEVCQSLAYAEARRRRGNTNAVPRRQHFHGGRRPVSHAGGNPCRPTLA